MNEAELAPAAPIVLRPTQQREGPLLPPVLPDKLPTPEKSPNPETPSGRLMWHIAQGNFEQDAFDPNNTTDKVSEKSYQALETQHDQTRSNDSTLRQRAVDQFLLDQEVPMNEVTPEMRHYVEMILWSSKEAETIANMLEHGNEDTIATLKKLKFNIPDNADQNILPQLLQEALYNPTSGEYGTFYTTYCARGVKTNELLAQELTPEQMDAVKPMLVDVLGGDTAFQALKALRQTQDMLETNPTLDAQHAAYTKEPSLRDNEKDILKLFEEGAVLAKGKADQTTHQRQQISHPVHPSPPSTEATTSLDLKLGSLPLHESDVMQVTTEQTPIPSVDILHLGEITQAVTIINRSQDENGSSHITAELAQAPLLEIDGKPLQLTFSSGTLTHANTDAILYPTSKKFEPTNITVATQIAKEAGQQPFEDAQQFLGTSEAPFTSAKTFSSGNLAHQGINHIIFSNNNPGEYWMTFTEEMKAQCIANALLEADRAGIASLTVPLIGKRSVSDEPGSLRGIMKGIALYKQIREHLGGTPRELTKLTIMKIEEPSTFISEANLQTIATDLTREVNELVIGNKGLTTGELIRLSQDAGVYKRDLRINHGESQTGALMAGYARIPNDIGHNMDAHGIAKGYSSDQLNVLNRLLTIGPDPTHDFHTMNLTSEDSSMAAAMGAANPYTDGGFIVVSKPHQMLGKGIGAVLVNEEFYSAIPTLHQKFPDVKFIRADQLPGGLIDFYQPTELVKLLDKHEEERAQPKERGEHLNNEYLSIGSFSEKSTQHITNEDSFVVDYERNFAGVFDGMGGHNSGDVASRIGRLAISEALRHIPYSLTSSEMSNGLKQAWDIASEALRSYQRIHPETQGMGTTCDVVQFFQDEGKQKAVILHAGDSRVYRLKANGELQQLTTDDNELKGLDDKSLAQQLQSWLDEAEGPTDPRLPKDQKFRTLFDIAWERKNIITYALTGDDPAPQPIFVDIQPTERILIVSDGISDILKTSTIKALTQQYKNNPQQLSQALVEQAKKESSGPREKDDDMTAVVVAPPQAAL